MGVRYSRADLRLERREGMVVIRLFRVISRGAEFFVHRGLLAFLLFSVCLLSSLMRYVSEKKTSAFIIFEASLVLSLEPKDLGSN